MDNKLLVPVEIMLGKVLREAKEKYSDFDEVYALSEYCALQTLILNHNPERAIAVKTAYKIAVAVQLYELFTARRN